MNRQHTRRSRLCGAAGIGLAVVGLIWVLAALPSLSATPNWAEDFEAYRDASVRLAEVGTLYLTSSLESAFGPQGGGLYLYPPPFGIAMTPFTGLPAETGAVLWYGFKLAALLVACLLMPVRLETRMLALGVSVFGFAVLRDLTMGNVSTLLLVPLAAGWRWLDRPAGSIALAVATAVRASTGAFLLWFLMRRAWRPLGWMIGTGLALILLSLPFVGIEGYRDYFTLLGNVSVTDELNQNRHVVALALGLGLPPERTWLVLLPTVVVALGAIGLSTRRDVEVGYMVAVAASLLLAPLMWDHYLVALLLPAAFLFERGRTWAIGLPLLSWLPPPLLPFVALGTLALPFLAGEARSGSTDASAGTVAGEASASGA